MQMDKGEIYVVTNEAGRESGADMGEIFSPCTERFLF